MRALALTIAGVYALVRVGAVVDAAPVAKLYPDTLQYLGVSHESPFSGDFWAGARAWTLPLLYKLVGGDHARVGAQLLISIVAWLGLAYAVARSIVNPRVAVGAAIAVLAFSCTTYVTQWDPVLLSESVSLSLTAALLAVLLTLVRRPRWSMVAAFGVLVLLWVNSRDPNAYVLLAGALVPLVWLVRRPAARRMPAVVLGVTLVVALLSIFSVADANRGSGPLMNVIGKRVLTDLGKTAFFTHHGLPRSRSLEQHLTAPGFIDYAKVQADPAYPQFERWVDDHGSSIYLRYFAGHPGDAISTTWQTRAYLFGPEASSPPAVPPLSGYRPPGVSDVLPGPVQELLFPATGGIVWTYFLVLAAIAFWLVRAGLAGREWIVPLVLLALTIPHAFVIALGDAIEVTRHALLLQVTVRLALLVLAAFLLDAWLGRVRPGAAARA